MESEKLIDQLEAKIWVFEEALQKISKINNKRDRFSDEIDGIVIAALGGK